MKKYKVIIPYTENKKKGTKYSIDFEVIAEDVEEAKEKGMHKFSKFLDFNLASWLRIPIEDEIEVYFIEDIVEPEPWRYL